MAVYDNFFHLYMSMRLQGVPAGPYAAETWQVGWRFRLDMGDAASINSGRQQLPVRSCQDAFVSRSNALFDIEQGFSGVTVGGVTITDADQDRAAELAHDFLKDIKTLTSLYYALDSIRLYPVDADGRSLTAPSVYTPTTTTANPTAAGMLPPDVSIAISTQTATRGVKGRGRIFVGAPSATAIDGTGSVVESTRQSLATAQGTMFNELRAMGSGTTSIALTPIVWHRKGDKQGLEDGTYASAIRAVRVDDRCDTQRRRDRQVQHNWTAFPLT